VKIGIPEYELTYLGEPVSKEPVLAKGYSTHQDFSVWIANIISFNIERGFSTSIIDVSEFEFTSEIFNDYPGIDESILCKTLLVPVKEEITETNHRVFFYIPKDYFLGSTQDKVISSTLYGLANINSLLNFLGNSGGIIVRVGSAYGNRKNTMLRFANNFNILTDNIKNNLMLVNDDRPSLFSVKDLLTELSLEYNIPIVFRTLSHYFNPGSLSHGDALLLSISTWKDDSLPLIIHAESKMFDINGIPESRVVSDYLTKRIPTFNKNLCVAIESTYKDLSCIRYINEYKALKPVIINKTK